MYISPQGVVLSKCQYFTWLDKVRKILRGIETFTLFQLNRYPLHNLWMCSDSPYLIQMRKDDLAFYKRKQVILI